MPTNRFCYHQIYNVTRSARDMRFTSLACLAAALIMVVTCVHAARGGHRLPNDQSGKGPFSDLSIYSYQPKAHSAAEVVSGNARFTVLTDNVIRLEYSSSTPAMFEDRATLMAVNRALPVPSFTQSTSGNTLTIATSRLTLTYEVGTAFSYNTLSIVTKDGNTWRYGDVDSANLLGTIKSLDELCTISLDCQQNSNTIIHNEQLHCAYGVVSRGGWTIVNDTMNFILSNDHWFSNTLRSTTLSDDLYFFGHGTQYRQALKDYIGIAGRTPISTRNLYASWFTRWYDYDHDDLVRLVDNFQKNGLPLDVLVLDMNWHTKNDWTGYTWDRQLFPFPEDTLAMLRSKGLVVAANIHDADGIGNWEDSYKQICGVMGQNPSAGQTVMFQPLNGTYMRAVEDVTLKQFAGFDFYWIDWQQGGDAGGCSGGRMNPTFITDHVRATSNARRGAAKRDNILARWGGLGNHRYQVGFSGDVSFLSWQCMAYQPYFSATAANVGYGSVSHDLVGPPHDHELHVRWMQFGAFSGVMRIHDRGMSAGSCWTTNDCGIVNVWRLPEPFREAITDVMNLRVALLPYIYTYARAAYDTGLAFVHPMYYDYPTHNSAYSMGQDGVHAQYFFGDDMFVAPIAFAASGTTQLAAKAVWVPPGCWYDAIFGSTMRQGDQWVTKQYSVHDVPRFIRCGSIIPQLRTPSVIGIAGQPGYPAVDFHIYAASTSGSFDMYEDDGQTYGYITGAFATTSVVYNYSSDVAATVEIGSLQGTYNGQLTTRNVRLAFVASAPIASASVNSVPIAYQRFGGANSFSYDGAAGIAWVDLGSVTTSQATSISVTFIASSTSFTGGVAGFASRSMIAKRILDDVRETPFSNSFGPGAVKTLASTAASLSRLSDPSLAAEWLAVANGYQAAISAAIQELNGNPGPTPPPAVQTALIQLWSPSRTDMCLCGSADCVATNGDYEVMWTEGYQPLSGGVPFNDYWSNSLEDNWGDTTSTPPSGYQAAIFVNGQVLSSATPGAVCLEVWYNSETADHMTLASDTGRNWAMQHNYQKTENCIGYALTSPPEEQVGARNASQPAAKDAAFTAALALLQSL